MSDDISSVNFRCVCSGAGDCPVFNRHMPADWVKHCQRTDKTGAFLRAKFAGIKGVKPPQGKAPTVNRVDTPKPGDELERLLSKFGKIKTENVTCSCSTLKDEMNNNGVEWCKENATARIVPQIIKNIDLIRDDLSKQEWQVAAAITTAAVLPESLVAATLKRLVLRAIKNAETAFSARNKGKNNKPSLPNKSKYHAKELSQSQKALYRECQSKPRPSPDPFYGVPVVHFIAHLWPVVGNWEWHVDNWNEIAESINGSCIVTVVTDDSAVTAADVKARLSDRFTVNTARNTPGGENPSFSSMLPEIPKGNDDVFLYAHGKGVRSHTFDSESVRIWTQMMYETILFNVPKVLAKLAEGYKCFGSFRTFGTMPLSPTNKWHYSGTFFAVRAKHVGAVKVKSGYGGVEAWPGDTFKPEDAWCEFTDCAQLKLGYDIKAMYPTIVDAQMQWEVDRIGGPRCEQHLRELNWFAEYLRPNDRILVIGSKHGGLEHALRSRIDGLQIVSIDIKPQADNTQNPMIVGSSAAELVQERARVLGPFDVVFIDGDHSYKGVKIDWQFAQSLNPRIIAFHDIAEVIKHRREGCEVDRLWAEIKQTHVTSEKLVGCGWGGIGVVFV